MDEVRTRIAPSPTGAPHIGTAYIALHNYAFAKSRGGKFLLRIEDTDRARSTLESEAQILRALRWMGLQWDEGPDVGGPHGPYRQSERTELYRARTQQLLKSGHAYRCFCTREQLDELRALQTARGEPPGYDGRCRKLATAEADGRASRGEEFVVRLKMPRAGEAYKEVWGEDVDNEDTTLTPGISGFFDGIRKEKVAFENRGVDDQVLLKADGFPTYHLANVVDDHEMRITHVMRGEEWISSTPKHIRLYQAFGWTPPRFMHLPLLRNSDKSKISKRKNPTSLSWFQARGYCRPATVNFLALMGYSRADGRELFDLGELVAGYDAARLSTTAPIFDFAKLDRFNTHYLVHMDRVAFGAYQEDALHALLDYLGPLLPLVQERSRMRTDLDRWTSFLFEREPRYVEPAFRAVGLDAELADKALKLVAKELERAPVIPAQTCREILDRVAEKLLFPANSLYMLVRVAVMFEQESLPLFEVLEFLGPDLVGRRLKEAAAFLRQRAPAGKKE